MRRHLWTFFFSPHHAQHDHALWFAFGNSRTQTQCKIQPARLDDWGIYLSIIPKLQSSYWFIDWNPLRQSCLFRDGPATERSSRPSPSPWRGAIMCPFRPREKDGRWPTDTAVAGPILAPALDVPSGKTTWLIHHCFEKIREAGCCGIWPCNRDESARILAVFSTVMVWSCVGF